MTRWTLEGSSVEVDTDPGRLDVGLLHSFLTRAYWSEGRTVEEVRTTLEHSLTFGLYEADRQLGFARVVTDYVTFGYLADVFVVPEARGRGLGAFLVGCAVGHEPLRRLKNFLLFTRDAHGLYRKFGFNALEDPARVMYRRGPWTEPAGAGQEVDDT